jgi:hypothetical protein
MRLRGESKRRGVNPKTILKRVVGLMVWSGFKFHGIGSGVALVHTCEVLGSGKRGSATRLSVLEGLCFRYFIIRC